MSIEIEVGFVYKGEAVIARCDVAEAEPDVGIMGPYPQCIRLFAIGGEEIPLTDDEHDDLMTNESLCDLIQERYYGRFGENV